MDVSLQLLCTGQRVNRNFASRRALKLPDVAQRSEALWRSVPSWPQHWHIDRMEASLPSWLASSSQLWLRLERGAQKRTGSRQILGRLLSSTETVDITSLRGSGNANTFSCGLPFGLGALSPLTRLGKQGRTLLATVWRQHSKRTFCSLLQSRQQRRLKQTVVLGCVARPPAFKRISTLVCPLPFGLLSDFSPRKKREGSETSCCSQDSTG